MRCRHKPPRRRLAVDIFRLAVDVARLGQPQHRAERAQVERAGRLVRLDFDGPDAHAGLALDHHAVAALEREAAGEKVVQVADREKADRDNPGQFRSAFERVDLVGHYWLLSASPTVIHHCSACMRGFAISSIAAAASTAPLRLTSSASSAKLFGHLGHRLGDFGRGRGRRRPQQLETQYFLKHPRDQLEVLGRLLAAGEEFLRQRLGLGEVQAPRPAKRAQQTRGSAARRRPPA